MISQVIFQPNKMSWVGLYPNPYKVGLGLMPNSPSPRDWAKPDPGLKGMFGLPYFSLRNKVVFGTPLRNFLCL
jgi:hypothetical protein